MFFKMCTKCKIEKPIENFNRDKNRKDGHYCYCRECVKIIGTKWYMKHPEKIEKIKATQAKWYQEHKEQTRTKSIKYYMDHTERSNVISNKYKKEHQKEIKERNTKYYLAHKKQTLEYGKKYRKTEKGKLVCAATSHNRRAAGYISSTKLEEIKYFSNGVCPYCLEPIETGHFDHIVSVAKGGKTEYSNILYVCADCNHKKSGKDLDVFLTEQSALGRNMQLFEQVQIFQVEEFEQSQ